MDGAMEMKMKAMLARLRAVYGSRVGSASSTKRKPKKLKGPREPFTFPPKEARCPYHGDVMATVRWRYAAYCMHEVLYCPIDGRCLAVRADLSTFSLGYHPRLPM